MKALKTIGLAAFCLGAAVLSGCGRVPKNTVFSTLDLPGKTIGVQQGTTGADYAASLEEEPEEGKEPAEIHCYDKGADAVDALAKGEIDCVIIDNEPAKIFVADNTELQILPDIFADENYAIAVQKENDELLKKIDTAMRELKDDGTIDKILQNYIGDSAGSFHYASPEGIKRENGTLTMATNAEFPPYEYKEDGEILGIDPDIMLAICDKLGMELEITDMEFDEILPAVKAGEYDVGVAGITVTEDRLLDVSFTDSYAKGLQVIITRRN